MDCLMRRHQEETWLRSLLTNWWVRGDSHRSVKVEIHKEVHAQLGLPGHMSPPSPPSVESRAGWQAGDESGGDEGSVGSGLVPLGATGDTGAWGTEWAWICRGWLGSKSWGQVPSLILHGERVMAGWMCPGGSTQAKTLGMCSTNTRSWRGLKWGSGSWGLPWIMIP